MAARGSGESLRRQQKSGEKGIYLVRCDIDRKEAFKHGVDLVGRHQRSEVSCLHHRFPERYFDVGIAEQHGVTFAGGLAVSGMRPVVAIYSTFLQRAYDQVIHDICVQDLHIVFAMDRAGDAFIERGAPSILKELYGLSSAHISVSFSHQGSAAIHDDDLAGAIPLAHQIEVRFRQVVSFSYTSDRKGLTGRLIHCAPGFFWQVVP